MTDLKEFLDALSGTALRGTVELASAPWSAPTPIPTASEGSPTARSVYMVDNGGLQAGIWTCTPGVYASDHRGYLEFMHIVEGRARLVGDDGIVWTLQRGTVLVIPDGWTGRWEITETITKSFAIFGALVA